MLLKVAESYGYLFNADALYNLSEQDMRNLEKIDEVFLRKVLQAHSKTAIESLYLGMGCKPVRFYLSAKQLNFLLYILNLDDSDLLKKVYKCQIKL